MKWNRFLVMLLAIVAAIAYAYFASPKRPETFVNISPKEYIERIEGRDPPPATGNANEADAPE